MHNIDPTEALNKFIPLPCVFVISADETGKPSGMMASWFTQTSFDPVLVAVSVGKQRYTHSLIKASREFVIAVPNKKLEKAVLLFGNTSGKDTDKFKESGVSTAKGECLDLPLLADATMNYECKLVDVFDTGDHSIFVGKVAAAWVNDGQKVLINMGKPDGKRLFEEF
jgi:flavin reductase (DIM6/NTAB) family NADH-FMN oxidoreductase RutF